MSQSVLLDLARDSIEEVLETSRMIDTLTLLEKYPILNTPNPLFITLICEKKVRGSSGSLRSKRPLIDDIIYHAKVAAFEDENFSPLRTSEYLHTTIELSLLSNLLHVEATSFNELINKVDLEVQGICFSASENEAIFLPQHSISHEDLHEVYNRIKPLKIYTFDVESAHDKAIL